jgi:protein disulfide-isomerase A6
MGVKGFPTLKIVRPSIKKGGQPSVDDYQGARTAKAIVDAVVEKIPNHVKRVTDKTLDGWLKEDNDTAKAILFSDKATTSALLRALAVDFLGSISFGQIRDKEKEAVESFGITSYPKFVLLPGGDKEGIVYDGKLEKDAMSEFVSQVASPNPDPAPEEPKKKAKKSKKDETKAEKASASFSKESAKHKASDASSAKLKSTSVSLDEQPTESPDPKVDSPPSVKVDPVPMISVLGTESAVREKCLSPSSRICALVLLPSKSDSDALFPQEVSIALRGLGEVYEKHSKRKAAFPFYAVEPSNPLAATIRDALGLKSEQELEIIAVNAKRSWWRKYSGKDYGHDSIENWVDTIRMNEGKKEKLPESLLIETTEALNEEKKAEEEKKEEKKKAEEEEKERDEL